MVSRLLFLPTVFQAEDDDLVIGHGVGIEHPADTTRFGGIEGVRREEGLRRVGRGDVSVKEERHVRCVFRTELEILGGDEHGHAALRELVQKLAELALRKGIDSHGPVRRG